MLSKSGSSSAHLGHPLVIFEGESKGFSNSDGEIKFESVANVGTEWIKVTLHIQPLAVPALSALIGLVPATSAPYVGQVRVYKTEELGWDRATPYIGTFRFPLVNTFMANGFGLPLPQDLDGNPQPPGALFDSNQPLPIVALNTNINYKGDTYDRVIFHLPGDSFKRWDYPYVDTARHFNRAILLGGTSELALTPYVRIEFSIVPIYGPVMQFDAWEHSPRFYRLPYDTPIADENQPLILSS